MRGETHLRGNDLVRGSAVLSQLGLSLKRAGRRKYGAMSELPAVYPVLRLAPSLGPGHCPKCDRDVKLHLPEALYEDLTR